MLDPTCHPQEEGREKCVRPNVSSDSLEGVGGLPGCDSREVELENLVSELQYRLAGMERERTVLRATLAASEEQTAGLTVTLQEIRKSKTRQRTESGQEQDLELALRVEELQWEREKQAEEVRESAVVGDQTEEGAGGDPGQGGDCTAAVGGGRETVQLSSQENGAGHRDC